MAVMWLAGGVLLAQVPMAASLRPGVLPRLEGASTGAYEVGGRAPSTRSSARSRRTLPIVRKAPNE